MMIRIATPAFAPTIVGEMVFHLLQEKGNILFVLSVPGWMLWFLSLIHDMSIFLSIVSILAAVAGVTVLCFLRSGTQETGLATTLLAARSPASHFPQEAKLVHDGPPEARVF